MVGTLLKLPGCLVVTCPICQQQFLSLMSHVVRGHKVPLGEFLSLYPGTVLVSEEVKGKASASCKTSGCGTWRKGMKETEESRKANSERNKGAGNGFYGKKHTDATRSLMAANHADFTGENNPLVKALKDPAVRQRYVGTQRKKWADLLSDPARKDAWSIKARENGLKAYEAGVTGSGRGHQQGWFENPECGQRLFYRSSYELQFLEWSATRGLFVAAVTARLPYLDGVGTSRAYIPDFLVNGHFLVEVKPRSLFGLFNNPAKFAAGKAYAKTHGLRYLIVDEQFLSDPDKRWSDELRLSEQNNPPD